MIVAGMTTLIVAHRCKSILDVDWLIVMRNGEVCESGAPAELLARDGGHIRRLVEEQDGSL